MIDSDPGLQLSYMRRLTWFLLLFSALGLVLGFPSAMLSTLTIIVSIFLLLGVKDLRAHLGEKTVGLPTEGQDG